jgi:D-alanyl-D-alanine endopeptidase (penicillin-binding protein 7)
MNKKIILISVVVLLFAHTATALEMPASGNALAVMSGVSAEAYIVTDAETGQVIISQNADKQWTPASLTKLMTVLVVMDTKPKLDKLVTMTKDDQTVGWCTSGGACVKSAAGVKFTVDGLFHAALMPSANNATNALARSTGLSKEVFVKKMNEKAIALGAINTHFNETTGLDPENKITVSDYAKIASAAFNNSYIRNIGGLSTYILRSGNNSKYTQTIKNTNKLLTDPDITMLAAKTGYLNESGYNFASLVKSRDGQKLIVVVLGEKHLVNAFAETKKLTSLALAAKILALATGGGFVLGVNTNY